MRLTTAVASSLDAKTPLVVLLLGDERPRSLPGGSLGKRAARVLAQGVFDGSARKTLLVHADEADGPRALMIVGVGTERRTPDTETLRRVGAIAVNEAAELGASKVVVAAAGKVRIDAAGLGALGEGAMLASYRYPEQPEKTKPPRQFAVVSDVKGARSILARAQALGEAANAARHLADLPSNIATPKHLARFARKLARDSELRCKTYGERELERLGMGALLGVGQGSEQESQLIELDYKPRGAKATVCLVGKGVCFDTGGISLKPPSKMEEMKYDMCGAAAVLGAMHAVAALAPKGVRVIGLVGAVENMPDGRAYKPGDVVKSASGKTIEVINTDAEGRVVLADVLHHATSFEPDAIVDVATLTGAIVIALGHEAAGLFCRDDSLARRLEKAAARTDERVWRMPTYDEYAEKLKSRYADIRNVTNSRDAGSCSAAQFLFSFSDDVPHAHLDIAGVANDTRGRDYHREGAVGFGVRLLYDTVEHWLDD